MSIVDYYRLQKLSLKYRSLKAKLDEVRGEVDTEASETLDELDLLIDDFYESARQLQ